MCIHTQTSRDGIPKANFIIQGTQNVKIHTTSRSKFSPLKCCLMCGKDLIISDPVSLPFEKLVVALVVKKFPTFYGNSKSS
jgi:hypothetical protein